MTAAAQKVAVGWNRSLQRIVRGGPAGGFTAGPRTTKFFVGVREVVWNITENGTAVPGVVTVTELPGEKLHVVAAGIFPGHTKFTVPVKILSGTSCRLKVPAEPARTEISVSCPLASAIW